MYCAVRVARQAKFHYAILVADRSEAGRRPAASWNLAYHLARYQRASKSQQDSDKLRTCLPPGQRNGIWLRPAASRCATRFELSRHVQIARTWSQTGSKPNSITLSWSQTGSKLVTDLLPRASSLLANYDMPNSSSLPVCDQLRTCLRPGQRNGIWHEEITACWFVCSDGRFSYETVSVVASG